MAEQSNDDQYIKCSRCKCNYHNNDDNIKLDFGHNRLGERFKNCVKCREKCREVAKKYNEKKLQEEIEENHTNCTRCRRNKPASDYEKASIQLKTCGVCRLRDEGRIWSK